MSTIQDLSPSEKMLLAEELWDSAIRDEHSIPLSEEHKQILQERLAAYQENPDEGISWEMLKMRIMESE